ncbi:ABC transporter permease [Rivihabitans pingtungensis]|uniref:Putative spermidine/putrescine transport system permease protein n=1 Tax=Rivihabitans pingtungensis TaxID=1054498 RepID=A0A318KK75_9NEIS|nr:ABC transporter permease [Rivihabitans pingtungensis]PXX77018.1 putative spermidine/putrescine transport system permease protein [Rivihabitans pingtungensis]HNX70331.1 ABC transporter permease [Rivihabitans pingtungensis]
MNMTADAPLLAADGVPLAVKLKRAERRKKLRAALLVAPLAVFLLATFILPIALLLYRSVENPEVPAMLPKTVSALAGWQGQGLPDEAALGVFVQELTAAKDNKAMVGNAAKRLNMEISGYRSLLTKTVRAMPLDPAAGPLREQFVNIDERWAEADYWRVLRHQDSRYTGFYLQSSLDIKRGADDSLHMAGDDEAIYLKIFGRTLWMSAVVTLFCFLLGYPLAYWLVNLPTRKSNLLMIVVLLPFWTSVLVRVAAWIVLLQNEGLINGALMAMGFVDSPVQLAFNRIGVYIAMVHILLPFMILPVFSVMKAIPPTYMRAAVSLGSHPIPAFWKVYFPQTVAGVGAGALLVFIMSIGYYITPALLGGPDDQMVSYYVAFFTNNTVNWGMAAALGSLLLIATMALYTLYARIVGANRLSLG